MENVFVTYRWENAHHNDKVIAFVNYLRKNGYEATMDKLESQKETAKDFIKMMHQAITDFQKVIVILSPGYKSRADNFEGGVGTEYSLIIKDIADNPNKYILVSFQKIDETITPLNFRGREIVYLEDGNTVALNKLHAKLQDEKEIEFANVRSKKPPVTKQVIGKFPEGFQYEKRFQIYKTVNDYLLELIAVSSRALFEGGEFIWYEALVNFNLKTKDAPFFFDSDIINYLDDIRTNSKALTICYNAMRDRINYPMYTNERNAKIRELRQISDWLQKELEQLEKRFQTYLGFKKLQ